jgi:lipopolysaccharide export system ATP-binding protein
VDYKEIKTTNINKFFGKRQVLNNVTISLKKSEVVTLLGPNGSGKTTLFYIIAGLLAPEEGKVFINNIDVTELPMYQRARLGLGYLPQEVSIFRGLTVEENIEVILSLRIEDKIEKQEELKRLLEEFSIFHLRKSSALALSGGEKRRLEIARALAGNPEFILLDEPFAGVDPLAVGDIQEIIRRLKKKNIGP